LVSVLLYYYGRISRMADRYASVTGKGYRPRPFDLGRWRWLGGTLVAANFLVVLALPMAALLWMSLMPFMGRVSLSALRLLTLDNYAALLDSSESWELALNTVIVSAAAATIAMLLTVIAGWLAARRRPGGAVLDQLTTVPLVFPGIVLGVALIEIALRAPFALYGTLWIIIIAFVIRYMPYGMRYAYSGVLQIHRELEEAAGACGASRLQSLRRVVAPLLSPAIVSGWLFIFLIGAKELSLAVLLAGPGSQTMAVAMFDLWQNGQAGEVSALGLVWSLLMTVCALSSFLLMRRHGVAAFGK
jgi:iron(III) transport system permease protein